MSISFYQVVNEKEDPIAGLQDDFKDALEWAERQDEPTAIIEYKFEFSDTELVWTSDGGTRWPPERTNT